MPQVEIDWSKKVTKAQNDQMLHDSFVSAVKAEAKRRIVTIMPEWKQSNALALGMEMTLLHGPNPGDWPPEQQAQYAETIPLWTEIKRLRAVSDEIESVVDWKELDIYDDSLWAAAPEEE